MPFANFKSNFVHSFRSAFSSPKPFLVHVRVDTNVLSQIVRWTVVPELESPNISDEITKITEVGEMFSSRKTHRILFSKSPRKLKKPGKTW